MDLNFHRERISRCYDLYLLKKEKAKRTTLIGVLSSLPVIVGIVFLGVGINYEILFALMPVVMFLIIFPICVLTNWKRKFFANDFNNLIINILNEEENTDLNTKNNDKYYKEILVKAFFTSKYDNPVFKVHFNFNLNDVNGSFMIGSVTRSNGQSSYDLINGMIIKLDIESNYNCQIRNDLLPMESSKKQRELFTSNYKVYFNKNSVSPHYDSNLETVFEQAKLLFTPNKMGIDFQRHSVSIFINKKIDIKLPKEFSEENVVAICNQYLEFLENIYRFISIVKTDRKDNIF